MSILSVKDLCKNYPGFCLDHVSFSLEKGRIMGFIGRNGAGKTTTLKSLLNFIHPDGGEISFFDESFAESELDIKQRIGFVSGGINYYSKSKIRSITQVTRRFYSHWDEEAYRRYMKMFNLDENKTPEQLSEGMKVKYALTLALSHNAELLLLDEPTSGLDPVSRDDLLDVFLDLAEQGISILFSTHITSDLDKCADDITYIKSGRILASMPRKEFISQYQQVELTDEQVKDPAIAPCLIGAKRSKDGYSALVRTDTALPTGLQAQTADLESIMVHLEKE